MLLLLFELSGHRFAIPSRFVEAIVPRVALRPIPESPPSLLGVFNRVGRVVPVVDLGQLMFGQAVPSRYNSRIILLGGEAMPMTTAEIPWIGVLAERVDQIIDGAGASETSESFLGSPEYLGPIIERDSELIQLVQPDRLFRSRLVDPKVMSRLGLEGSNPELSDDV